MALVAWFARTILAVAFVVAAGGKLTDLSGTRDAVRAFGVPRRAVPVVAVLLPIAEIATAILLVVTATGAAGEVAAIALLVVFSGAMLRLLARGERPSCRCFGQASEAPIGAGSLLRNGVLLLLAVFSLCQGLLDERLSPHEVIDRLGGTGLVAVALAVVTVGLGAFCRQLFAQNGRILQRLTELEARLDTATPAGQVAPAPRETRVGRAAPEFTLPTFDGQKVTLADLPERLPVALFFLAAQCGPCEALLPDIRRWVTDLSDRLTFRLVVSGQRDRALDKLGDLGKLALYDESDEVGPGFGVPGTPSVVVVDRDLRYASEVAPGQPAIGELMRSIAAAPPPPPTIGDAAPDFDLVDQRGEQWSPAKLAELGGGAVIFWDPGCGFCRALEPQLLAAEAEGTLGRYVILSAGPIDAAAQFDAPVLVDPSRRTAQGFGISGTPIAVAIDDHGLLASAPAPGGPAVLGLLGAPPAPTPVPVAPPVRL